MRAFLEEKNSQRERNSRRNNPQGCQLSKFHSKIYTHVYDPQKGWSEGPTIALEKNKKSRKNRQKSQGFGAVDPSGSPILQPDIPPGGLRLIRTPEIPSLARGEGSRVSPTFLLHVRALHLLFQTLPLSPGLLPPRGGKESW